MCSITEKLADHIRMCGVITTDQCVSALSDEHAKKEVLAELAACKRPQALDNPHNIVYDAKFKVWCLPEQLGKLGD